MKKLLALFLALIMVFTLFPVSALAEEDALDETPAEEMTKIAEEPQPDPGENSGEIPEEKAEETPAEESQEPEPSEETQEQEEIPEEAPAVQKIAFLGADVGGESHYRVETAVGETVTLAPQPNYADESVLTYVWARFDTEQNAYVELPEESGSVLMLTASAEEIGVEKLYACTVTAPDAAGTAVFTLVEKAPAEENEPEAAEQAAEEQTAEENTPVPLASSTGAAAVVEYAESQKGKNASDFGFSTDWCALFVSHCGNAVNSPLFSCISGAANGIAVTGKLVANNRGKFYSFAPYDTSLADNKTDYYKWRIDYYITTELNQASYNTSNIVVTDAASFIPAPGDFILFTNAESPKYWQHIGIVRYVSGGTVYYVDGNGNGTSWSNSTVDYHSCSTTYKYVIGYVRPDYTGSLGTKPAMTASMSVDDYLYWYAQSVTTFSGTATPKNSTASGYYLPTSMSDTVAIKKTYSSTMKLTKKVVNHAGNTWYQTSDGYFVWSDSITISASPTISGIKADCSGKGIKPQISFNIGWASSNKPVSWTLEYGITKNLGTEHTEKISAGILNSYNPIPCSVQFGTEEPALRYLTDYFYQITVTTESGEKVKSEILSFTTDKCTNHTWDSGTVTTQPICCTDGVKTFKCTNPGCGETKTEAIPRTRDHKWNSGAVTKQPTCVATGIKTYTCTTSGCGATTTETVAATGKHTWNSGAVTTPAKPGAAGVKTYTCTVCSQTKTESIPALPLTYTVSYDANGGSGAPASQTKTHDETLTLSAAEPSRDGWTFLGWATDRTATSAQYQPGDSYTANADAALYAVWEENAPSIEEQLRAAIANGESQFDIPGDCVLSADLTVPANFNLYVDQGTLTIPNGVTLTVAPEGFFGSRTDTVIRSGGRIVNNGTINSFMGGSITIENGGTLENNWSVIVFYGGSLHNNGTYTPGEESDLSFDIDECDLETGLTGVDRKLVTLESSSGTEASIRALFAEAENVKMAMAHLSETTALTLAGDLTIPENGYIVISGNAVLTVPQGKTLTNNGSLVLFENGRFVVESGAKLVNNNYFAVENGAQASVAGTLENNGWANVNAEGWNCTGTLTDTNEGFTLYADAATADELEAALRSGVRCVNVTADITLDRSITVPQDVQLNIEPTGKLTVPAPYTLACNGTITVYGTLDIGGTYSGEDVLIFEGGTLTNDSIPHRNETTLATEITITGADTLPTGGSAQYSAEILPADVWQTWVKWSIVSGKGLAAIYEDGTLVAGDTPGAITIRADAADGSGVYAEKTVTIQAAEPEYETKLTVSTAAAAQGEEATLDVAIEGNPGLGAVSFRIDYDKTRIQLIGYEDAGLTDWSVSVGTKNSAVWIDENGNKANGNILRLKFRVLDDAEDGLAYVTLSDITVADVDETIYDVSVVAGEVTVTSRIPGDINGDGIVNVLDCLRLKKYLAGFDVTIVEGNADVTGDGNINVVDCLRLKKYLAGFDVEIK